MGAGASDTDDPPIVLLHGFTGSAASWSDDLRAGLGADGSVVLAVDLPGHGRHSEEHPATRFTLEHALSCIVDAAPGRMDLVGYSMGGRIALHFAAAFPERVRRLVLESASPGLASEPARAARRSADEALASRIEAVGVGVFLEEWSRLPLLRAATPRPSAVDEHVRSVRLAQRAEGLAGALRGLGSGALPSLGERLAEVRVPTLILVGAEDAKFVDIGRRMAAELPDATVEVVRGAGHTVHLDRPDAWVAAVRAHLAQG